MFIGNNAIKWHFVFCHCISVSLNKFCIQPSFLMILCTLKAKKYFQTININDSVSWVKYAVWSDRSTYCYLEIYELWAFISGRQFLATKTKVKVKWKSDMDNYLNISSLIAFEDSWGERGGWGRSHFERIGLESNHLWYFLLPTICHCEWIEYQNRTSK